MGSYTYGIVVERDGQLLINENEVNPPKEIAEEGGEAPLRWALDQVREMYRSLHAQDPQKGLSLSVSDRRIEGLPTRSALFTSPDQGITIESFVEGPSRQSPDEPAPDEELQTDEPETGTSSEDVQPPEGDEAGQPVPKKKAAPPKKAKPKGPRKAKTPTLPPATKIPAQEEAQVKPAEPEPNEVPSRTYAQKVEEDRNWAKIEPGKNTRPQVGSAENAGKSKKAGLKEEARRQKAIWWGVGVFVVILIVVGLRIFTGGTSYDALCVDQRTMTRAVSGVACQNAKDTNHRWWYTEESDSLPQPGDTVPDKDGSFNEPNEDRNSITMHVERE